MLDAGLAELGLRLPPPARRAVEDHVRLLFAWNDALNLTAIRDPAAAARLHVLDSLTAVPTLRAHGVERLLDLGSGGGFPGLPLAVALDAAALLVDSVGKKVRFLEAVAQAVRPGRVSAQAARAEALAAQRAHRGTWPAVTARAVAPLGDLVELAFPLLRVDGVLVAWKRGALDEEVAAGRRAMAALGGGELQVEGPHLSALGDHRLIIVRKTGPTADTWPRDPAARRRRPWSTDALSGAGPVDGRLSGDCREEPAP